MCVGILCRKGRQAMGFVVARASSCVLRPNFLLTVSYALPSLPAPPPALSPALPRTATPHPKPARRAPRFRAVHEEAVKLDQDFGSSFSGILTDERGRVRALWGSYAEQVRGAGRPDMRKSCRAPNLSGM